MRGLIVKRVDSAAEARRIEPQWQELVRVTPNPNPFYRPEWLLPAWEHFADADACLLTVWSGDCDGRLVGLLPIVRRRRFRRIPFPHLRSWAYLHCYVNTPLIQAGLERDVWAMILDDLRATTALLLLQHIPADTRAWAGLSELLAQRARAEERLVRRACLWLDPIATSPFEAKINNGRLKEYRRQYRRLLELGDLRFVRLSGANLRGADIDAFIALEARGWKGRAGTALDSYRANREFADKVLPASAEAGFLHCYKLRLRGACIASLLCLEADKHLYLFKIAYEEELSRFSPGVQLILHASRVWEQEGQYELIDSCAASGHSMIDKLWYDRRTLVSPSVSLRGWTGRLLVHARRWFTPKIHDTRVQ